MSGCLKSLRAECRVYKVYNETVWPSYFHLWGQLLWVLRIFTFKETALDGANGISCECTLKITHLTELKAAVHEAKLAKCQRGDRHTHACAEESFVRTGYNTARSFLFVWVFFPFFFTPPQDRRKLQYLTKLVKCLFLACISYTPKPHHTISLKLQVRSISCFWFFF